MIDAYGLDFEADVAAAGPMLQEIQRLAGMVRLGKRIALRCLCAPRECHAEMLAAKIAELSGVTFEVNRPAKAAPSTDSQEKLF